MPKFRKKAVMIEAVQFTGEITDEIRELIAGMIVGNAEPAIFIYTLAGQMKVSKDDWIICDVKGDVPPPDAHLLLFEATYEAVDG
jgi:hypothetical protein